MQDHDLVGRRSASGTDRNTKWDKAMGARATKLKAGQRYEFVCLQIDIAGHSKLKDAERILHAAKERFHGQISGIVATYGGLPFKWEGDGGAFLFPATDGREFDEATLAAFRILESLPSINEELRLTTELSQPLAVRISLDSGQAVYNKEPGLITGDFLNAFLKNERNVALVDTVTVTDRVHRQLAQSLRSKLTQQLRSAELECDLYRSSVVASQASTPKNDEVFNSDDVKQSFGQIKGMNRGDLEKDAEQAVTWLIYNGINTKEELDRLSRATFIHDCLSKIYVDELLRPAENPLDPVSVATWGAFLLRYGPRDENIEFIKQQLKETPEHKSKHA